MDLSKLAETVLLELECFWTLQELDHGWRSKEPSAVAFLQKVYANRSAKWADVFPLLRPATALSLLAVPIDFAFCLQESELKSKLKSFDFHIRKEHCITYREHGVELTPTESKVLMVLRNAVAHLSDFAFKKDLVDVNISFGPDGIRCWSKTSSSEVIFREDSGFIEFLGDLIRLCRQAAGELVKVS